MNKQTRAQLTAYASRLSNLQDELNAIKEELSDILSAEQDKYDNMPENLQGSERGEAMQAAIDSLENVNNYIDESADTVSSAIDELNDIIES